MPAHIPFALGPGHRDTCAHSYAQINVHLNINKHVRGALSDFFERRFLPKSITKRLFIRVVAQRRHRIFFPRFPRDMSLWIDLFHPFGNMIVYVAADV